jgi:hypothetical protein
VTALVSRFVRASIVALLLLSALYIGWGLFQLVAGGSNVAAIDLRYRWSEGRYFVERMELADLARQVDPRPPELTHGPVSPNYPPWSFVTGLLAAPPVPFGAARIWMALLDVVALAAAALFASRALRGNGPQAATLGALAVLACIANMYTLSAGQYGLVVNALVVGAIVLDANGRWIWAGIVFALALVKPQSAGLFALVLLVRGSWRPVALAGLLIAVEGVFALAWLRIGPLGYADQIRAAVPRLYSLGYGPLEFVVRAGGDGPWSALVVAVAGLLVTLWLLMRNRDLSLLARLAIAGVAARLWTYHNAYDNVLVAFLAVALVELAWNTRLGDAVVLAAATAVMVSLAAPLPWNTINTIAWLQVAHVASWVLGVAVVVARAPRNQPRAFGARL